MAIDIGSEAIDREATGGGGYTRIDKANPANATGTITSVEIWAVNNLVGVTVGTFYLTGTNILKCRASQSIGDVTAGSKQTKTGLSIAVVTGDYFGIYWADGGTSIEQGTTDAVGLWYVLGEHIDAGDEATYTYIAGYANSFKGLGVEAAVGRSYGYIIG
jgi:hypothetical protein